MDKSIRELQNRAFLSAKAKGWVDRPVEVPEQCALIHSEISEALESWRNKEPIIFAKNGKPEGVAAEYADAVIRIMHYASLLGFDLQDAIESKMDYNDTRAYRHGGKQA
jgi:NTP pyrophosphatase (non-canonical NTP hydrolase)